eukprot:TRINITY_DN7926_c0_g1_i3.p1 TRINITY_DN7926_c0_g1~~TRINITY_DN7926_c0_g1_i3.p1  ORF type:complete len:262 (+),score=17.94 TRINITY_DN7926_c0_g1_i3:85-870(+)
MCIRDRFINTSIIPIKAHRVVEGSYILESKKVNLSLKGGKLMVKPIPVGNPIPISDFIKQNVYQELTKLKNERVMVNEGQLNENTDATEALHRISSNEPPFRGSTFGSGSISTQFEEAKERDNDTGLKSDEERTVGESKTQRKPRIVVTGSVTPDVSSGKKTPLVGEGKVFGTKSQKGGIVGEAAAKATIDTRSNPRVASKGPPKEIAVGKENQAGALTSLQKEHSPNVKKSKTPRNLASQVLRPLHNCVIFIQLLIFILN